MPGSGYHLQTYNISDAGSNAVTTAGDTFTMPDADVTVSATFVSDGGIAPADGSVYVENDGHGTASASLNGSTWNTTISPSAGTTVTLTATPSAGYFFDYWEDEWGNISFANSYNATTSFIMPNGNVKVKAHFEDGIELNGNDDSGITDELRMVDGDIRNVRLTRTFPKGKKQTVCLPFKPTRLLNYGRVWEFTGIDGSGRAVMTKRTGATGLQDNTPYIFEAHDDITGITFSNVLITIGADPKTEDATAGFTFHGTYERKHWEDYEAQTGGIYGFVAKDDNYSQGQFVKAYKETFIRPFRAYLIYDGDLTGTTGGARRRTAAEELPDVIDIVWVSASEGTPTGIDDNNRETIINNHWYSLDGRRLSGRPLQRGIYINNGKKVVIK